ncbi:uncharacterized protein JN550_001852 [Neoarthrinium moseri]|uniref:uncharacterized protein n=1 Tax=Neoarthrinium moseri TaxID=1658444 RepID=UPI001FDAEB6C|nr:uncharacterized protein JN550_001852 [Neoarthrinium moseri]KAI1875566.1 hypothetical protein JN550_001852 [Neoarthrinium moseri]
MIRASVREYVALLGVRSGPGSSQAISSIWARSFSSQPQFLARTAAPRRMLSSSTRPHITTPATKFRPSPWRSSRRNFHNSSRRRDTKNTTDGASSNGSSSKVQEPQGLSARLKKLSREYGWTAVGVYLALSVLDFPFCFLLVRVVGTDRIGEIEHYITSNVKKLIPQRLKDRWHEYQKALKQAEKENLGNDEISEHVEMAGWGVQEAEERNKAEASLGTQLALAYAIHKSFIFIRVPLTAAVLPKVVKVLRSWGWKIGKKKASKAKP